MAEPGVMDAELAAAARALAIGDTVLALKRVALRQDAPALALRGIVMARLGDFDRATELLRRAGRLFGPRDPVARARCTVAETEIALASRDLAAADRAPAAAATLEAHGDSANALHARCVEVRRLLLLGRLAQAEASLRALDLTRAPPPLRAVGELLHVEVALRSVKTRVAREALGRAAKAARQAGIPALSAEVDAARRTLETPAARLIAGGRETPLRLDEVEALFTSKALIVDAHRNTVRDAHDIVSLARRPILFALARALAETWPEDASRATLIARAFAVSRPNDSHRARLRVEVGRLRRSLRDLADLRATPRGFVLLPRRATEAVVLARPVEGEHAHVLALLADGESWSSSAIALALGASQRTVQRALLALERAGAESGAAAGGAPRVRSYGRARARRWLGPPLAGFTTTLLLSGPLPIA